MRFTKILTAVALCASAVSTPVLAQTSTAAALSVVQADDMGGDEVANNTNAYLFGALGVFGLIFALAISTDDSDGGDPASP
jgi:hypothetical protein